MAQINLLKQTAAPSNFGESTPKILIWVFGLILIGLLVYYAFLFFQAGSVAGQTTALEAKISSESQQALSVSGRDELLTRQLQLKDFAGLVSAHVYWSQLFPELARVTLKTASYNSLQVDNTGDGLSLDVTVPTLSDLDKYMQIFDLPQFNQNFSNVRIGSFSIVAGKSSTSVRFQVKMDYNPSLIQYQAVSASAPIPTPVAQTPSFNTSTQVSTTAPSSIRGN